jgi:hypothetical protein
MTGIARNIVYRSSVSWVLRLHACNLRTTSSDHLATLPPDTDPRYRRGKLKGIQLSKLLALLGWLVAAGDTMQAGKLHSNEHAFGTQNVDLIDIGSLDCRS